MAAIALLGAVAAAGCGLGAGASVGNVRLTVTRDYGTDPMLEKAVDGVHQADTVLRVLDRSARITARYGGGFVQSIDGVAGGTPGGRVQDWFFYVNGVESGQGAADYRLHAGDRIWWDYRDWTAAMRVPAVVGSFPEPFRHGYQGVLHPADVRCFGGSIRACGTVRGRLRDAGADLSGAHDTETEMRVIVGPWKDVGGEPPVSQIGAGPATSGVFATFDRRHRRYRLTVLDAGGSALRQLGPGTGLVAAVRRGEDPPTWVITGTDPAGVRAAAALLDVEDLHDRYAVAVSGGRPIPLPGQ